MRGVQGVPANFPFFKKNVLTTLTGATHGKGGALSHVVPMTQQGGGHPPRRVVAIPHRVLLSFSM